MQRKVYQEQLKRQAEEAQKRKAAEKQRDRDEDERLQRKIEMDILREKEEKQRAAKTDKQSNTSTMNNNTISNGNTTNVVNSRVQQPQQNNRKNFINYSSQNTVTKNSTSTPQLNLSKNLPYDYSQQSNNYAYQSKLQYHHPSQQPQQSYYPQQQRSIYNYEQEKLLQQEMENRALRFKQTLDRKLQQVYRQLESSKKNQVGDNVVDEIRRRLRSNSYVMRQEHQRMDEIDGQKSMIKQFEEEFSQFYKIPKKNNDYMENKNRTMKNLDYSAESRYNSRLINYTNQGDKTYYANYQNKNYQENSRINTQRQQRTEYNNEINAKWGTKKNSNFLGNREALDYKIESTLSNIDNMIDSHSREQQNQE